MDNEKETKKNSMYIEVENEEEILRLQQEVIKSNLPIEDVAKIVGKLQKLLELTKHNSIGVFAQNDNKIWDWTYKPFGGLSTYPIVETNDLSASNLTNTSTPIETVYSTSTPNESSQLKIRNDVPF